MPAAFSDNERVHIIGELKKAAVRSFTTIGLKKTSLAELAEAAGIVKSTFYVFFDSKEALYLELLLERAADTRRLTIAEGLHKGSDTRDALRRYLRGAVEVLHTDPLYRRLASHPEEIAMVQRKLTADKLAEAGNNGMAELATYIADKQAAGQLPGTDPAVIVGVLRTVLLIPLHAEEFGQSYQDVLDTAIDALTTGLTALSPIGNERHTHMNTKKKAIIVGAGIAGLAAAVRLGQAGWTSLVVEKAPARREGGYAVTFSGIGYDAAERMGVLPQLIERQIVPDALHYIKPSGARHFTVPGDVVRAMIGERSLNLMRGDIENVLYQRVVDDAEIRFATSIEAVTQTGDGVHVTFSDGSAESADLLIGADGLHSTTRALAFGPESRYRVDLQHMVGVFTLDKLPEGVEAGATESLTATGRTLAIVDNGNGRATAFFGYRTDQADSELADGPQAALPRAYGDMGWAAPEVLQQLKTSKSVYFDTISQMVVDSWSKGRVVLLGDAAWCVTLFAGFGSSLAVAGADQLGTALEACPNDIETALARWETALRPEAEKKQKLGRRVKGLYAPKGRAGLWLRDLPLRTAALAPMRALLKRRLQLKG